MNAFSPSNDDRLWELLADEQTFGLSAEEQAELDGLLQHTSDFEAESMELAASAVMVASFYDRTPAAMPADLEAKILAAAPAFLPNQRPETAVDSPTPSSKLLEPTLFLHRISWFVAAAVLLLAAVIWSVVPTPVKSVAEQREQLISEGDDLVTLDWSLQSDPEIEQASGDVVWSQSKQTGFMRFQNLPKNDPNQQQYQLWIIDGERDAKFPVDGGVFDISDDSGEVIVPINAKLPVYDPKAFAITIEPPGGVVVSTRERLPLLAVVPEG